MAVSPRHAHAPEQDPAHTHAPGKRSHDDHEHPHGDHGPDGDRHEHPAGVRGFLASILKPHSHDAADSVDSALESSAEGIRALKISLAVLGATAFAQLAIVLLTGSVALVADTIHNFSDALTAIPLWIAFSLARRPSNRRYTYGYGRFEDIAGLFIVAMIALSCVLAGYESVRRLIDPQDVEHVWVVLLAGIIGFAGNELVAVYRIRVGTRIGSAALVADGLHARTDGFTSLAVAAGAVGVLMGFPLADPIVGLLITVAILFVLRGAARHVFRRLMDAVEPGLVDAAEAALAGTAGVEAVSELRLRWIGHRMRAEAALAVADGLSLADAQAIVTDAQHRLIHAVPKLDAVNLRAAPACSTTPDPLAHRHAAAG